MVVKTELKLFFYVWLEFYRQAQFHITTSQRVIRIMHYSGHTYTVAAA